MPAFGAVDKVWVDICMHTVWSIPGSRTSGRKQSQRCWYKIYKKKRREVQGHQEQILDFSKHQSVRKQRLASESLDKPHVYMHLFAPYLVPTASGEAG